MHEGNFFDWQRTSLNGEKSEKYQHEMSAGLIVINELINLAAAKQYPYGEGRGHGVGDGEIALGLQAASLAELVFQLPSR